MMGLSVTTQQVFHGQTLNFAKILQQKYAFSWNKYENCLYDMELHLNWNVLVFEIINEAKHCPFMKFIDIYF